MAHPLKQHSADRPIAPPHLGLAICLAVQLLFILCLPAQATGNGCTTKECHAGIMDIVPGNLPMMTLIRQNGLRHQDMDGCVVCHGGNPSARDKASAHKGIPPTLKQAPGPKAFYPDPGNIWIADNTCGVCHAGYVYRVTRSLMNTEAGKIQGNLSTWGAVQNYKVTLGNHDMDDPDGPLPSGSTLAYEDYVARLAKTFPGPFPNFLSRLPLPETAALESDPGQAAYLYQRQECQRCHLSVAPRKVRGEFRGTGCSACHMPYAEDGLYQGKDKSIPKDQPGHIRVHRIAGNRKTKGIPIDTCLACHNRGKRIGVSFTGKMESGYPGAGQENADALYGKAYIPIQADLHHQTQSREGNPEGGLLCQDCHTSMDVHGDGNIKGTTLAQVEIECTDCHGTPELFPWELPLGRGDEFGIPAQKARGLARTRIMSGQQFGFDYDPEDGYLISARGNPLGNVVRRGDRVVVHSATGKDFFVPVVKGLAPEKRTIEGRTAMDAVSVHLDRMECYACHGSWAPQCYGCHIEMDFSRPDPKAMDWVKFSNESRQGKEGLEAPLGSPARVTEKNSYMRWETPVLGINGEGRISPIIPGCQVVVTLKNRQGKITALNHVPENPLEALAAGQPDIPKALDMAPVQPHTSSRKARSCESCHSRPKTLGLGIDRFNTTGLIPFDWSQVVSEEGGQLATVGTHWPKSRALNKAELDKILKTGTCLGCHQHQGSIRKKFSGLSPEAQRSHMQVMEALARGLTPSIKP